MGRVLEVLEHRLQRVARALEGGEPGPDDRPEDHAVARFAVQDAAGRQRISTVSLPSSSMIPTPMNGALGLLGEQVGSPAPPT